MLHELAFRDLAFRDRHEDFPPLVGILLSKFSPADDYSLRIEGYSRGMLGDVKFGQHWK